VDGDSFQEPKPWDGHGTACAGLAAAVHDNVVGIRGIGGGCSLMAARIAYSQQEGANWTTSNSWIARAIDWAWENGADVLSNSWGGGTPSSAIINAFGRARTQGRGGKGSVVVVAAGNDSSAVDFPGNLPNVLTVSASNEFDQFKTKTSGDGETWWGSNFGPEVDVAAPGVHNWTTDISGSSGYRIGNYTDFNGTSSATPIVAGACGLILSANPNLTEAEVRAIVRDTADKVGGQTYVNGRNDRFGFGRLNCRAAIEAARPQQPAYKAVHKAISSVPINDNSTCRLSVAVGDTRPIRSIEVQVDIEHTYIGDLTVVLLPPAQLGAQPVQLHGGTGGGADNIKQVFTAQTTPALAQLAGKALPGAWSLEVTDNANRDEGAILSFGVELGF
jgi:subtilisin-like proprotein convertase family protein